MNLNYRRHKSSNVHFQRQQKINSKTNSKLLNKQYYQELFSQAKNNYHEQKDLQRAIKGFQQYLEVAPQHDEASYLCGVCLMQVEQFQKAVSKFENVSDHYYLKHNALLLASMAFNKMGNLSRSYLLANQCIRRNPLFQEAVCFHAKLNIQMGQYLEAEADFRNAIKLNPQSFLGLVGLGDCCRYFNKYAQAIEFYNKSLETKSKQNSSKETMNTQINLKIAICYYFLQKYQECVGLMKMLSLNQKMSCSQLYYYYGLCQLKLKNREKGINHLQYSIRLDTNNSIVEKAYKKLILLYLQNYQFYEAERTIKMGKLYNIKAKQWENLIALCMLVIKNNYPEALKGFNLIYNVMKEDKPSESVLKIDKVSQPIQKVVVSNHRYSNVFKRMGSKQNSSRLKKPSKERQKFPHLKIKRSIDKIESMRINTGIHQYQSFPLKLARFKTQYEQAEQKPAKPFTEKEKEIVYPIVLQFKAYCEFFNSKTQNCIQTYQQYQAYIQNHFGKESNIKYSKFLCQILLLIQADQPQEALIKCNQSIDLHFQKYGSEPVEPILYKICILIKMAMASVLDQSQNCKGESNQILLSTLEMIYNKNVLHTCPIAQYYTAIIFILLQDFEKAKECMQSTVRLSEQCSFNIFYSKAILQMKMGYFITAFKDITTSLVLKKTSRAYLARCLILLRLSEEKKPLRLQILNLINMSLKSDTLQPELQVRSNNMKYIKQYIIEKCLNQLQEYIEHCQEDQDQITIWVTKILFACKSFDQAILSFDKVNLQCHKDIYKIAQCLSIYSGDFQKGGRTGAVIKQAFDATFLSQQEEQQILKRCPLRDYSGQDVGSVDESYEKWLVVLHLYMKQEYSLCIQYIQMLILGRQLDQQQQFLLRYNLAIIYLIVNDYIKAIPIIESLSKFDQTYNTKPIIERILEGRYVNDQCLNDLSSQLFIRSLKMLSNYLSYKSIYLLNNNKQVKVYARINIPFPSFYRPNLAIQFDLGFILSELNISNIPKRIEAPWIKRVNNSIQFTQSLNNTIISFDSKPNQDTIVNVSQAQPKQSQSSIV